MTWSLRVVTNFCDSLFTCHKVKSLCMACIGLSYYFGPNWCYCMEHYSDINICWGDHRFAKKWFTLWIAVPIVSLPVHSLVYDQFMSVIQVLLASAVVFHCLTLNIYHNRLSAFLLFFFSGMSCTESTECACVVWMFTQFTIPNIPECHEDRPCFLLWVLGSLASYL